MAIDEIMLAVAGATESLQAKLATERAKYAELQRYNVGCTKQRDALLTEDIDLKEQLSASRRWEEGGGRGAIWDRGEQELKGETE